MTLWLPKVCIPPAYRRQCCEALSHALHMCTQNLTLRGPDGHLGPPLSRRVACKPTGYPLLFACCLKYDTEAGSRRVRDVPLVSARFRDGAPYEAARALTSIMPGPSDRRCSAEGASYAAPWWPTALLRVPSVLMR